jgi:hypothetical protein
MQRVIALGLAFSSFYLTASGLPRLMAQEEPCLTRTIPVTAVDAHGTPLQDLQASSLAGKVHGRPAAVLSTTLNIQPHRIMVCVDMSGSMWGPDLVTPSIKWPVTRIMLEDIAQAGPTVGQLGMELFAGDVFDVVDISPDPAAFRMKATSLQATNIEKIIPNRERGTALWDALWKAADQFTPPRPGDVIYALTDGDDNRSQHTDKQLEEKLLSLGIRVFAFIPTGASPRRGWTVRGQPGPEALRGIVGATGGNLIYSCPDPQCQGLTQAFGNWTKGEQRAFLLAAARQLYQQMVVSYDTGIRLPMALKKGPDLSLVIVDDRGHKRKDIELLYPHRLPPCEKTTPMAPTTPD